MAKTKDYKKARIKAHVKGNRKSDFALQAVVRDDVVHFDRIYFGPYGEDRTVIVSVKRSSARKLGEWLVKNA